MLTVVFCGVGKFLGKRCVWLGKYPAVHEHTTRHKKVQKPQLTRNVSRAVLLIAFAHLQPRTHGEDEARHHGLIRSPFSPSSFPFPFPFAFHNRI